jgi:hypothetical protein
MFLACSKTSGVEIFLALTFFDLLTKFIAKLHTAGKSALPQNEFVQPQWRADRKIRRWGASESKTTFYWVLISQRVQFSHQLQAQSSHLINYFQLLNFIQRFEIIFKRVPIENDIKLIVDPCSLFNFLRQSQDRVRTDGFSLQLCFGQAFIMVPISGELHIKSEKIFLYAHRVGLEKNLVRVWP